MSLPISGKPGITIINALYTVFCTKKLSLTSFLACSLFPCCITGIRRYSSAKFMQPKVLLFNVYENDAEK